MRSNKMLVGSDVELLGISPYDYGALDCWEYWCNQLSVLPPKGERLNMGDEFWAHRDGISAEYGFAPTTSLDQFMTSLEEGKRRVSVRLGTPMYHVDKFHVGALMGDPAYKDYLEMGCQPDWVVAANGMVHKRIVPPDVARLPVRECSGHIHISLPEPYLTTPELRHHFVRELDGVVYPLTRSIGDVERPTWYRKRCVFRPTSYGIEYRSIGAGALLGDGGEAIMGLVFSMVRSVWEM